LTQNDVDAAAAACSFSFWSVFSRGTVRPRGKGWGFEPSPMHLLPLDSVKPMRNYWVYTSPSPGKHSVISYSYQTASKSTNFNVIFQKISGVEGGQSTNAPSRPNLDSPLSPKTGGLVGEWRLGVKWSVNSAERLTLGRVYSAAVRRTTATVVQCNRSSIYTTRHFNTQHSINQSITLSLDAFISRLVVI